MNLIRNESEEEGPGTCWSELSQRLIPLGCRDMRAPPTGVDPLLLRSSAAPGSIGHVAYQLERRRWGRDDLDRKMVCERFKACLPSILSQSRPSRTSRIVEASLLDHAAFCMKLPRRARASLSARLGQAGVGNCADPPRVARASRIATCPLPPCSCFLCH